MWVLICRCCQVVWLRDVQVMVKTNNSFQICWLASLLLLERDAHARGLQSHRCSQIELPRGAVWTDKPGYYFISENNTTPRTCGCLDLS